MQNWYSIGGFHDPMSSLSHLVGCVVFMLLSILMLRKAHSSALRFRYALLFCLSVVLLLTMSFVYHMMEVGGTARVVMRCLDIAAIFVLIAASFTVIHGILYTGWRRWGILVPIWGIAIVGITLRSVFYDSVPDWLGIGIFLLMGWIGALSAYLLWHSHGAVAVRPLLGGGILYSLGALSDGLGWPTVIDKVWGPHESFHLFVLAGLGVHWVFVDQVASGKIRRVAAAAG